MRSSRLPVAVAVFLAVSIGARASSPPRGSGPPPALQRLESAAEDVGDAAARHDWSKAQSIARSAEQDLRSLARQLGPAAGAARRDLQAVQRALRSRQSLEAQFAANALSRDVVGLYTGYQTAIPLDVMRLDVLLRQVQLEATAGSRARASAALKEAQGAWAQLAPGLPRSAPAVQQFERQLQDVSAALSRVDLAATQRAAAAALEGVDGLESLYDPGG